MALFSSQSVKLKNGAQILLRPPTVAEAQSILDAFIEMIPSSPYVLSTLESAKMKTLEKQVELIRSTNEDARGLFIVAEHEGRIVAMANMRTYSDGKRYHRGGFGMSVREEYRGLGLGKALLDRLIELSREIPNMEFLELNVMGPNTAAHQLYLKSGFIECGRLAKAYRLEGGSYADDIMMYLAL